MFAFILSVLIASTNVIAASASADLSTTAITACPNLSGTYAAQNEDDEEDIVVLMQQGCANISIHSEDEATLIQIDNQNHTFPSQDGVTNVSYRANWAQSELRISWSVVAPEGSLNFKQNYKLMPDNSVKETTIFDNTQGGEPFQIVRMLIRQ